MKNYMKILLLLCCVLPLAGFGQKIVVKKSSVTFFSDAAIEDITATTTKASGIIDLSEKKFAFSIPIKEFEFEKTLMKEHFNEKYMETEKFPKATFTGTIDNIDKDALEQQVKATGKLTIHGVTREVEIPASIKKEGAINHVNSKFVVRLEDYAIQIPQLLFQNIAESVEVTVDFRFGPQ
jgi:polyisoprenoid-binding protein YceI